MKPGMQRELLVAYWLLFDEFEIGDNDPAQPQTTTQAPAATPKPNKRTVAAKPPRNSTTPRPPR